MTDKPIIATPRRLPGALSGALKAKYDVREPENDVAKDDAFLTIADGAAAIFTTAFDEMDTFF